MSTEATLRSLRRWLVVACFLLALVVAGVGLTAYAVDRYSGGQFLGYLGVVLAVAILVQYLRLVVARLDETADGDGRTDGTDGVGGRLNPDRP